MKLCLQCLWEFCSSWTVAIVLDRFLCCRGMCAEAAINYIMMSFLSRLLSFPTNLINASDTRRGIAKAFGMWSDVSPFTFREVPADQEADIKIGGYSTCGCPPKKRWLRACRLGYFFPCCHPWSVYASKLIKSHYRNYITKLISNIMHYSKWKKKKLNNFHTCQHTVKQTKLSFICPFGCKLQGPA